MCVCLNFPVVPVARLDNHIMSSSCLNKCEPQAIPYTQLTTAIAFDNPRNVTVSKPPQAVIEFATLFEFVSQATQRRPAALDDQTHTIN